MNTYWRADGFWGCKRHLVSKFPANLKRCYYSDCPSVCGGRPDLSKRGWIDNKCSLDGCTKEKRDQSKYCSDECRKKYARKRYVEKTKAMKHELQYRKG